MADLWKRRERAEKPADEFLNEKFGYEDYARAGNLGISLREKEISPEYYEERLAMFHALFAEHNEAFSVALWNTVAEICGSTGKGGRFDKADFTKEELDFIASVKKEVKKTVFVSSRHTVYSLPNPNKPFGTDKFVVRPVTLAESEEISKKYKLPPMYGDFLAEDAESGQTIGVLDVRWSVGDSVAYLIPTLFVPEKEDEFASAVKLLSEMALAGKLWWTVENVRRFTYQKKRCRPQIVRYIEEEVSEDKKRLLQKSGFKPEIDVMKGGSDKYPITYVHVYRFKKQD
ncbi:MAG TPA: hypothetical protein DEQ88_03070 [Clostridiales bacterium]|nr:hypothetical protein [Clostridiales bacterium]